MSNSDEAEDGPGVDAAFPHHFRLLLIQVFAQSLVDQLKSRSLEIAAQIQERDEMIFLDVWIFVDERPEFETHHRGILEFQNLGQDREHVCRRSLLVAKERSTA